MAEPSDRASSEGAPSGPSTGAGTGELSPTMTVAEFAELAISCWRDAGDRSDQTVARMSEIVVRFARRLNATGVSTVERIDVAACDGFINAPSRTGDAPADATRHFRRVTLRALFRTGRRLGVMGHDPTLDIELPARSSAPARPLSTDEVILCRTASFPTRTADLRRPTAWALAEATAATSEIPELRRRDLRPVGDVPEAVALPGTRRLRPRTVELTDWGQRILTRRLEEIPPHPDTLLAYVGGADTRSVARHASACGLVSSVLTVTRLASEPDIRPASVRNWRARHALDDGASIEDVANLLGHRSLDDTATAIGHDWQTR